MKLQPIFAVAALVGTMGFATAQPAKADSAASTRNIILGVAAAVAGIAIEANVNHKNAQANTVQGYLPDGATVYDDGHVVEPNGQSFYPSNQGRQVACDGQNCRLEQSGNDGYGNNGYANNGYRNNGQNHSYFRSRWNR